MCWIPEITLNNFVKITFCGKSWRKTHFSKNIVFSSKLNFWKNEFFSMVEFFQQKVMFYKAFQRDHMNSMSYISSPKILNWPRYGFKYDLTLYNFKKINQQSPEVSEFWIIFSTVVDTFLNQLFSFPANKNV